MTVYYVKPNGNDTYSGESVDAAWRHIQHAIESISSGDIVKIFPGIYRESIDWRNRGMTPDKRGVVLEAYDPNHKPTVSGPGTTYQLRIYDRGHITLRNIRFADYRGAGVLVRAFTKSVSDIVFDNCEWKNQGLTPNVVLKNNRWTPITEFTHNALVLNTKSSSLTMQHVNIIGCRFENIVTGVYDPIAQGLGPPTRPTHNEGLTLHGNIHYCLIEGCLFDHIDSLMLDVLGTPPSHRDYGLPRWVIIRNNTFRNVINPYKRTGKLMYFDRPGGPILVENNSFQDSALCFKPNIEPYPGPDHGHGDIITRNNVFYSLGANDALTTGSGSRGGHEAKNPPLKYINQHHISHNVIMQGEGRRYPLLWTWCKNTHTRNNVIVNRAGKYLQGAINPAYSPEIGYDPPPATPINWSSDGNLWWTPTGPGDVVMTWGGLDTYRTFAGYRRGSKQDSQSVWGKPVFVDESNKDYRLAASSPGSASATPLTYAVNQGTASDQLKVADSRWFCDGWGMISGDAIRINNQPARVLKTDWSTNTLTLDRKFSWQTGDPIGYDYEGLPSIGLIKRVSGEPGIPPTTPDPTVCEGNLIQNADFINGKTSWNFYTNGIATFTVSNQQAIVSVSDPGSNTQLYQSGLRILQGKTYEISFSVKTNGNISAFRVMLILHDRPYTNLGIDREIVADDTPQNIQILFIASESTDNARLRFWFVSSGQQIVFEQICFKLAEQSNSAPQIFRLLEAGNRIGTAFGIP